MYVITWQNNAIGAPVLVEAVAHTLKGAKRYCEENSDRKITWSTDIGKHLGEFLDASGHVVASWTISRERPVVD